MAGAVVAKPVVVALPVDASAKPGLGEDLVVELALLLELDLALEQIHLARELRWDPITKLFFPRSHDAPVPWLLNDATKGNPHYSLVFP